MIFCASRTKFLLLVTGLWGFSSETPTKSRWHRTRKVLLHAFHRAGRTTRVQTVAAGIVQLWPDDAAARNQDAYSRLLGASDGAAEAAERDTEAVVA